MKIRTLFLIALVFFSISSTITYAIYCSATMDGVAKAQYERIYSDIADNSADNVSELVKAVNKTASIIATDETVSSFNLSDSGEAAEAETAAKGYVNANTGINRIIIMNKNGDVIVTAGSDDDSGYRVFEKEQLNLMVQGDAYISVVNDNSGKPIVDAYEIACPYIGDDRIIMVYFKNTELDAVVKAGAFPGNGRIIIADAFGTVIDRSYAGVLSELAGNGGRSEYSVLNEAVGNSANINKTVEFEMGRVNRLAYTTKCNGTVNWYVSAMAEAGGAYTYSGSASSSVVGLVVGLSFLFVTIYVVAVILVTKPLGIIEKTLAKIHRGDHDSRVEIKGKNEYGDIAREFNTLLDNVVVNERRYRTIVEMSDDIVFEWNMKNNNIVFSNNFNKKFSYRAPSDHFSDSFFLKGKIHPEDSDQYHKDLSRLEKGEEFKDKTYRWKNMYGDYIWMQMKTSTIRDKDGNVAKIIGVLSDVDRAKKGEMQLIKRASYDALTGVYNRETIENVINGEIEKMNEGSDKFAILFVDIDDFKIYNDQYSHATGDQVLKFVTSSITEIIDDFGFIGRYGGDEFIVCIRNVSTNIPENVAKDILAKLKAGFTCDTDDHLTVSVSIGVYIVSGSDKTVEEIISIADDAMYNIKKNGKSSFGIVNG